MLTAIEPKYVKRQERLARMQESRERAGSAQVTERWAEQERWQPVKRASLRPLMMFLAGLLIAVMIVMQVRRQKAISRYRQALAAVDQRTDS